MANPEHVEVVRQGADAIAEWRRSNPKTQLDLTRADFENLNLSGAHFGSVNLDRARLNGTHLWGANLDGALLADTHLTGADLSHASLVRAYAFRVHASGAKFYESRLLGASLQGADFSEADLTLANFQQADLSEANLAGATLNLTNLGNTILRDVNLAGARLARTVLGGSDLRGAQGLASISHQMPSSVDHSTLIQSGELPLSFLRGVGLPDEVIEFYRGQYGKPIQFYSCFISYSTKDQELADRLHADLQDNGVRCWLASEDLKTGDPFRDVIDQAIRVYDKLLLILSEHSIASAWVQKEVETAFERERNDPEERTILFPIRVDEAVMETDKAWAADIRRTRHIGDFIGWDANNAKYVEAFERVLRDLRPEDS